MPTPKHAPRKKQQFSRIEIGLRRIYDLNKDGKKDVSLQTMDIAERPIIRRILLWFIGATLLIAAALLALLFLAPQNNTGTNRHALALAFTPPESLTSGLPATVNLTYENTSAKPLVNVDITLALPNSIRYQQAVPSPVNTEPLLWQFPRIEPGATGTVALTVLPLLQPSFSQNIQATARFQPEHLSVSFDTLTSLPLTSTASIFSLTSTQSERVLTEEITPYAFTIRSTEAILPDTYLFSLSIPEGFRIQNTQPTPKEDSLIWPLPALEAEKPYTITLRGSFSSDQSGEKSLIASIVTNDSFSLVQQKTESKTQVLGNAFSLSLFGNGQSGTLIATPGQDLVVSVALRNTGEESAENIQVELIVDNGLSRVDLGKRRGAPLGKQAQNKVVWTGNDLSRLATLRPNEDALLDTTLPTLLNGADTIELHAVATIKTIGGIAGEKRVSSTPLTIRLASNTTITAQGSYFHTDGTAVGTGPIPPMVGESTVYRLTLEIVNPLHALEQTILTAPLGTHASWQGSLGSDIGTVSFDSVSGRVRWAIGTLPVSTKPVRATFDIRLTPTAEEVNRFASLLGIASLTATDPIAQSPVNVKTEAVTTEIPSDTHAKDKGIVVEATPTVEPSTP